MGLTAGPVPARVDARVKAGLLAAGGLRSHDTAMVTAIGDAVRQVGVDEGDLAVLAARHKTLQHYRAVLRRSGIPFVDLEDYDGRPAPKVKLGTFKRAKGLEFKHVFLP